MHRRLLFVFILLTGSILATLLTGPPALAATCTWTGASTDWADAGNWANCSSAVPGGTDTAVIPSTSNNPLISANADIGTLTIESGATVTINEGVTVTAGSLNLNGTLTGGGDITVNLATVWNAGGVMSGSGETHIMGSATFDLIGYGVDLNGRTLRNEGAMTWQGPSTIWASSGAAFVNEAAGTIAAQATTGDVAFYDALNATSFQNHGAITVNGASSGFGLQMLTVFSNDGTVTLQNCWLRMVYGSANGGNFLGGSGAILFVGKNDAPGQTFTFSDGSNITIEYVVFDSVGTANVGSYFDASGSNGRTQINPYTGGTTVNFTSDASIVSLGQRLDVPMYSTVNLSSDGPVSVPRIEQYGILTGTTDVTVTSLYNWRAGTLGGPGTLTIADGATMYPRGTGAKILNGRSLTNHGTIAWLDTGPINGNSDTVVDNYGTFDAMNDATFTGEAGVTFNNYDLLIKSGGMQTTTLNVAFNNYGDVHAESGQIAFTYGGVVLPLTGSTVLNGGNLAVGDLLDIQGGTVTGSGVILGDVQNSGLIAPGQSPGAITIQGNFTQTVSGTLRMEVGIDAQDMLTVTGEAALAGTLDVVALQDYSPASNDAFCVLAYASHTGVFDTVLLPTLIGNKSWQVTYEPHGVYVQVIDDNVYLYLPLIVRP